MMEQPQERQSMMGLPQERQPVERQPVIRLPQEE
jgi:hypothetical protein